MKPIYHYTTADRLAMILEAEEITPSIKSVKFPEIPAVWLSTAADWEPTATKEIIENGRSRRATLWNGLPQRSRSRFPRSFGLSFQMSMTRFAGLTPPGFGSHSPARHL